MSKCIMPNVKRYGAISVVLMLGVMALVTGCQGKPGERGPAGAAGPPGAAGPAGALGVSTGTVSGVVVDNAGKPVEKAVVVTEPATASATTDKDGKYSIKNVPVGDHLVVASATGLNAAASKVAVLAGKEASVKLTLTAAEPFPLGKVRAISGTRDPRSKEFYPEGKVAITLSKYLETKKPYQRNNKIITSGLPNVGVGTYVYLEGAEKDGVEKKITSWAWSLKEAPPASKAALENANTRYPRFLADKAGEYLIEVQATNEEGKKASSRLEVNAGYYVGSEACYSCHSGNVMPNNYGEWEASRHAKIVIEAFDRYSDASDYCLRCHTVGYDETAKNRGFDEAAREMGWDPAKESFGSFKKNSKLTPEQLLNSKAGKLAGVQCESCHGPGYPTHTGAKSLEPGVCTQCHPQQQQWDYSGHAKTGSKEMHMAEGASCVQCHTGQGFVAVTVRGEQPVFPNMAREGLKANLPDAGNMAPVACATCHDPHQATEPIADATKVVGFRSLQLRLEGNVTMPNGVTVDAKDSAACVSCHADKRDLAYKAAYSAGKNARGAHDNTQADVFYGITAAVFDFGGAKYASSPHATLVKEACIQCHMAANPSTEPGPDGKMGTSDDAKARAVGGHSWNMAAKVTEVWDPTITAADGGAGGWKKVTEQKVENVAACTSCHKDLTTFNRKALADYGGDGKVEGVQDEVDRLLKLVAAQLPKDSTGAVLSQVTADKTTELQRQALWNYWVIANDKSRGVHNTAFSVQVLQRTYKQLTGKDVPGATLR